MTLADLALVVGAFVLILVGAELFTGGIEWLGIKLGLSAGATGSILAAIGTATPETMIPVIAIVFTGGPAGERVGVGAILGAPFMLATLVLLLMGLTAYVFRGRRRRVTLRVDVDHASRDLGSFIVLYALALALALLPPELSSLKHYVGWVFAPAYVLYLFLVLRAPRDAGAATRRKRDAEEREKARRRREREKKEEREEREALEELELRFAAYLRRLGASVDPTRPPLWLVILQTVVSFAAIVVGARFFASFVGDLSAALGLDALLVALLLAPLATELPEAVNSLLWVRQGKDVIALGNVAGAMVFQSTIPVTIGVLLTPWDLGSYGMVAAVFALVSAVAMFVWLRLFARRGSLPLSSLIAGGSLYVAFVAYVVWGVARGG